MNPGLKKIILVFTLAFPFVLILAMLGCVVYATVYHGFMLDDHQFRYALRDHGIAESSFFFYHNYNGRLFSHFYLCTVFSVFKTQASLLLYRLSIMIAFIISLSFFLKNYSARFYGSGFTPKQSFFYAAFIMSFFFFLFFIARLEVWFWVSSTGVYLLSLIIGMFAFGLMFSEKQTPVKIISAAVLFFIAGGFSESYALLFLIVLLWTDFKIIRKDPRFASLKAAVNFSIAGSVSGILFNLLSNGAINRIHSLKQFDFMYSVKNTLHSALLPFLSVKYLSADLLLIAALFVYGFFSVKNFKLDNKTALKRSVPVFLFILVSFFIPCYILSDIIPLRAASLGYFVFTLFLFDQLIFRAKIAS